MNILLFGKTGQVGWELQRALAPLGNLIALDVHSTDYCGDFSNPEGVAETVKKIRPDVIVNAAAHTAVDKAESEPEFAQLLNATSVEAIAKAANEVGAWVIHYSTDYVFPGTGEIPWQETDATAPLNVYGETKLAGEKALQKHCAKHIIFRTSWVYAGKGNNFAKTMLRLAKEREELAVINDQFGAPTGAELLADCTAHAIRVAVDKPEVAGLYHLVAGGTTTWHDYAALVFEEARKAGINLALNKLNAVPTLTIIKTSFLIKKEVNSTILYIVSITSFMALSIYLFRDLVITVLFTEQFRSARELFLLQLVGDVIKIAGFLYAYPLQSQGHTKLFISSEVIFSILFIVTTYIFVVNYGVHGANISYVITYSLYFVFAFVFTNFINVRRNN